MSIHDLVRKQISSKNFVNYGFYFSNTILSAGTLVKSFPNMNREASRKLFVLIGFLARSRYILEKLFSRKPSGSIVLGQKFCLRMKCLEVICSYLTRSLTHMFVIVMTNAFGIDGGRLVLGLFYI